MSRIHFIGGEKGGVGKSVVARLLAQYYVDQEIPFVAFDGDKSHGAMLRYYADFTSPVDLNAFESADRIAEQAIETDRQIIVDLAAQTAHSLAQWMEQTAVLELSDEFGVPMTLWHVMDDGTDALNLLDGLLDTYGNAPDYVVVRNYGRGSDFSLLDESPVKVKAEQHGANFMDLGGLHAPTMRKIDRVGASFWAAANNQDPALGPSLGLLERQRIKVWLNRAYADLTRIHAPFDTASAPIE